MASLTKMMTALVALKDEQDDTAVEMTVPPAVRKTYGQIIYLNPGETYTFGQMLKALLLDSANDAAITIAVNVAGSQAAFVRRMNAEAATLGLRETHFVNVHGLDAPGHYSSAHDLALLGAAAMRDPVFRRVVAMRRATIPWPQKHSVRTLTNINRLLTGFAGADGIKTGYTTDALNCVVGSVEAGGHEVIAVVMGEGARWVWRDESALLNFGIKASRSLPLAPPATPVSTVRAAAVAPAPPRPAPARQATPRWPWSEVAAGLLALGGIVTLARRTRRRRRWRWRTPYWAVRR